MKQRSEIVRDPEILGGTPVFRGTRVPVQALLDYFSGGQSLDEFLDDFPSVVREQAIAVLQETKAKRPDCTVNSAGFILAGVENNINGIA